MRYGFIAASGRRVDWVHIPVLERSDDAFLAPLKDLKPQGARVYLGARSESPPRGNTCRNSASGAYCGFGRLPASELPNVLADHLKAAEIAGFH